MTEDGGQRQPGERPRGIPAELTAEEGTRPAWSAPAMHRFSLQRTLAGSSVLADVDRPRSAFPS